MQGVDHDWSEPRIPRVRLTSRAMRFIKPPSPDALRARVVVGISHRNQPDGLKDALLSVMAQDMAAELAILVLDDSSGEGWLSSVDEILREDPRLAVATGHFGSPAQARNALLDLVDEHFPATRWIARLDADDLLAEAGSLRALVEAGEREDCAYVLGSNMLREGRRLLPGLNYAIDAVLMNRSSLNGFIQAFCRQETVNELPSCNLLLRTRTGIRYPLAASAEDHWLVAGLLMQMPERGCIVTTPTYAIYSLGGVATLGSRRSDAWLRSRRALAQAADTWFNLVQGPRTVLGWGQEGVVWRDANGLFKQFYPYSLSEDELRDLQCLASSTEGAVIEFDVLAQTSPGALIKLHDSPLKPMTSRLSLPQIQRFLSKLYRCRVVTSNVKRDNLRLTEDGNLQYIDIGRDVVPLTASRFLDCAARLYAIAWLGWSDHELARRKSTQSQVGALAPLTGFTEFYGQLVMDIHDQHDLAQESGLCTLVPSRHSDVTLLIKACPQDVDSLNTQVAHIVGELRQVCTFGQVILLIDQHEGPYLRQYAQGNLARLLEEAATLEEDGWLDEAWVVPTAPEEVHATYSRWFGDSNVAKTHTSFEAPLFAQLWAFSRIRTPYVLQADVDVLLSLPDASHDVVADMMEAMRDESVWCVGFNIPKAKAGFRPYRGDSREFAPEVRLGLLNLPRILGRRPFENPVSEGRFQWMWHRVLKEAQPLLGMRSVRGGDSRSCYVHPQNADKGWSMLPRVRDLFSQGLYPPEQAESWDLVASDGWKYPSRNEDVVFLVFGRDSPSEKLERCFHSLRKQSDQSFGVVFIDDGGEKNLTAGLHHQLGWLAGRLTLIRRLKNAGYLANFIESVQCVCQRPETLLVVLDQDDALMGRDVVERIWTAWRDGADLINGPMFRPSKPLQLYPVSYDQPRAKGGGNVWAHLRAFRKSLFDQVPLTIWHGAPETNCLTDFLTMVPMAELAQKPVYLDGPYVYLHDREAYSPSRKHRELVTKNWLFNQAPLAHG